jgi:hypothetical protein
MTQADIPIWCLNFQLKLMAALDAAWESIEARNDPAALREARDKAKAIGDLAAMARKVALIVPMARAARSAAIAPTLAEALAPVAAPMAAPMAAQAEHAHRALDKLKGGRRGRL